MTSVSAPERSRTRSVTRFVPGVVNVRDTRGPSRSGESEIDQEKRIESPGSRSKLESAESTTLSGARPRGGSFEDARERM